jgi:hypothetical protein
LVFLLPVWYIFSILVRCGKINLATLLSWNLCANCFDKKSAEKLAGNQHEQIFICDCETLGRIEDKNSILAFADFFKEGTFHFVTNGFTFSFLKAKFGENKKMSFCYFCSKGVQNVCIKHVIRQKQYV